MDAFGDYELGEFSTKDALVELEESGTADFLFQKMVEDAQPNKELVPGTRFTKEQCSKLSPGAKLTVANKSKRESGARGGRNETAKDNPTIVFSTPSRACGGGLEFGTNGPAHSAFAPRR